VVRTQRLAAGADTDGDGIPDAWERLKFGNLTTADAASDTDHDSGLDLISPDGGATTRNLTSVSGPSRFFRVEAVLPLGP
jgi:hypothetical protein